MSVRNPLTWYIGHLCCMHCFTRSLTAIGTLKKCFSTLTSLGSSIWRNVAMISVTHAIIASYAISIKASTSSIARLQFAASSQFPWVAESYHQLNFTLQFALTSDPNGQQATLFSIEAPNLPCLPPFRSRIEDLVDPLPLDQYGLLRLGPRHGSQNLGQRA